MIVVITEVMVSVVIEAMIEEITVVEVVLIAIAEMEEVLIAIAEMEGVMIAIAEMEAVMIVIVEMVAVMIVIAEMEEDITGETAVVMIAETIVVVMIAEMIVEVDITVIEDLQNVMVMVCYFLFFVFYHFTEKLQQFNKKKMMTIHCAKSELDQKREKMIKP